MSPNVPLLVQVVTGCLFPSTGSSAFCTGQLDLRQTFDAPFKLGTGIIAGDIFDTPVAPRLQTEHHLYCAPLRGMMTSPVQSASATPAAIKGTPIASSGCGHGNQAATMSPNVPLLVQVLTACLFSSTGSSVFCTGQLDLRHTFDAPFKLGSGIVAGDIFDTPVAPRLQPEHHLYCANLRGMVTSPVQPASATPATIKETPIASSGSGHGNQAVTMSPNVPLLVQVGDWKYGFHSDDPCLIVLPCPHTIVNCISDCFALAGLLLSLSGDVEQNRGPITDAMFKELLETQKTILSKISQMQEQQASSESAMIQVQNRLYN
ncbi:uncharacterized protein LOC142818107 [Rhipicephalus microplus]|uniref:uncharacterized protein LOC142818107 n=1 Tax=Rhipicephalus microplus TaxID=6941 RepID=UPI003F6C7DF0